MPSPPPGAVSEDQQPLKSDKEVKAVFLPEERAPQLKWQEKLARRLKIRNEYARIVLAEFLGTFVLCSLGIGCIAQMVLHRAEGEGNIITIVLGWGMGVAMGVYMAGGVSGGHINPAFSTAMALFGRLPLIKLPFYWLGQYLGAFVASFCVWVVYIDGLNRIDKGSRISIAGGYFENTTDNIWSTFPRAHVSAGQGFADQIFATGLLVLLAMAITDKRNMNVPEGMIPIVLGFGVSGILTGYVANCGAALNPARDLGPRIFTAIAGWSGGPFSFRHGNWFWVPILGPHIGAILGALLYNICVGLHWPDPVEKFA